MGAQLLRYLSVSGLFITVALVYTGGLQGTGDTRGPLVHHARSRRSLRAARHLLRRAADGHPPVVHRLDGDLVGHFTRCVLTVARFQQGRWRQIAVRPAVGAGFSRLKAA